MDDKVLDGQKHLILVVVEKHAEVHRSILCRFATRWQPVTCFWSLTCPAFQQRSA
jgi:hypothetical protein